MEEKKIKKYYIHTINGKPAEWYKYQIVYSDKIERKNFVKTLYMIRKQQEMSKEWREEQGWECDSDKYGYMIVRI